MSKLAARSAEWRQACGRVHARAKQLGLDPETRRDLQRRETGKESCADMSAAELRRVLAAMNGRAGSRGTRAVHDGAAGGARKESAPGDNDSACAGARDRLPPGNTATRPLLGKLRALWISGYHLGVVRDRTDAGLARWLRRQTGLDAAEWVQPPEIAKAVEALQAWLARDGGVDWSPYPVLGKGGRTRQIVNARGRVLEAQWRILHRLGAVTIEGNAALASYACRHAGLGRVDSHLALTGAQEIALMQHLGARIRKAQAEAAP